MKLNIPNDRFIFPKGGKICKNITCTIRRLLQGYRFAVPKGKKSNLIIRRAEEITAQKSNSFFVFIRIKCYLRQI